MKQVRLIMIIMIMIVIIMIMNMIIMIIKIPNERAANGRVWRRFEARETEERFPRGRKLFGFTSWN